jgi:hypothetical protein
MSTDPFARNARAIPVTLITGTLALPPPMEASALVVLDAGAHAHAPGEECFACASVGDIRARLFNLNEQARLGDVPPFKRVVVDARRVADKQRVIDALTLGILPANGLRDHAVARNFYLESVL